MSYISIDGFFVTCGPSESLSDTDAFFFFFACYLLSLLRISSISEPSRSAYACGSNEFMRSYGFWVGTLRRPVCFSFSSFVATLVTLTEESSEMNDELDELIEPPLIDPSATLELLAYFAVFYFFNSIEQYWEEPISLPLLEAFTNLGA